ncbi:outer membrane murein-binding lipoprotein Lpp [Planomicrobium stackebrandtii]|uniref:Outer membrane murein-binding lipoprotein Lpp n=1 Tax=Planomicrobium stackebrandtii TaxID=253160 RepID=A0ABU0GPB8_9BACL|nr:hypothetical protein [Planomicrobium stackebrandtii]MDQ0427201.1 outer membrane murein-binding lipoprotein Lpp [Planomicrobium stackebrandtii]
MRKSTLGIVISAELLLAGCGNAEESAEVETTENELQEESSSEISANESKEQEENKLESPYQEIKDYFEAWELPEGGEESSEMANGVTYENGYTFDKTTKALAARTYQVNGSPAEPTEEQKVGVIMGWLADAAAIPAPEDRTTGNAAGQVANPLSRLDQVKELNDIEPLEEWIIETEEILKDFDEIKTEEQRAKVYAEGYERLQKINALIQEQ